jgi:1-pyrroline-5-carboxylate dehydrogenase
LKAFATVDPKNLGP